MNKQNPKVLLCNQALLHLKASASSFLRAWVHHCAQPQTQLLRCQQLTGLTKLGLYIT